MKLSDTVLGCIKLLHLNNFALYITRFDTNHQNMVYEAYASCWELNSGEKSEYLIYKVKYGSSFIYKQLQYNNIFTSLQNPTFFQTYSAQSPSQKIRDAEVSRLPTFQKK